MFPKRFCYSLITVTENTPITHRTNALLYIKELIPQKPSCYKHQRNSASETAETPGGRILAKDYYRLLGVEKTASADQIKKAFRKKAMEYHPDRAKDKAAAEAKFKEINEAYAVVGDEEKRRQYDMFGSEGFGQRFSQEDIFKNFNFGSIQDVLGDLGGGGDIFSKIFGGEAGAGKPFNFHFRSSASPQDSRGGDVETTTSISFEQAVCGGEHLVSVTQLTGQHNLKVKIPAGTQNGRKMRLRGKGHPATLGGPVGDLYLTFKVQPHPALRYRGQRDLEVDVAVGIIDLVLGGGADVLTLDQGSKRIKIKAGTQPGTTIRLRGFGVPANSEHAAGDLYAIISAKIPDRLTQDQQALFERLRESGLY